MFSIVVVLYCLVDVLVMFRELVTACVQISWLDSLNQTVVLVCPSSNNNLSFIINLMI